MVPGLRMSSQNAVISNPDSSGEKSLGHDGTGFLLSPPLVGLVEMTRHGPIIDIKVAHPSLDTILLVAYHFAKAAQRWQNHSGTRPCTSSQFQINSCHNPNNPWRQPWFLASK